MMNALTEHDAQSCGFLHKKIDLVDAQDDEGEEHVQAEMPQESGERIQELGVQRVDQYGDHEEDGGRYQNVGVET